MDNLLTIFRALTDPTRIRILLLLHEMELSIGEIAQILGQSQPRVSRHVKVLVEASLVVRRKEGSWVFLHLGAKERVEPLFSALDSWDKEKSWRNSDLARLNAVRADRAAAATRYFKSHAAEWDAIRSMHVAESEVEQAIVAMAGDKSLGRLVDIGTGTGRMLELLGSKADSMIGLDRSPEMLRIARTKLENKNLSHMSLCQGDMYALPLKDNSADFVILHQVLHYAQQPSLAIDEAARVLDKDGQLMIIDFASHDKEELRINNAHVRLGFSDEQISECFSAAGLLMKDVRQLKGGALTVKLWIATRSDSVSGKN
ncbi:MAG: metalloregulator ArsR/SmtB family transcription factor [Zymomonas mobilis subsp. pomaceae]|uniref:Transcriptional regulator, ArsR family n=1 Tax=Zymomonas mobilis subsp. pomaceae (strain ATCC 29192 / DSM 22645 / JCM 10191 / CCUG 17912 / NBRC 13757 / NCIMB 11200 / NRRL B-4491 / Barker I) TaxID=579138 RepID=F8EV44_ZYMMT|nr:metalloregulator ArsR/SmtB family transcription factor [Zymomonas mobilis]AEI38262.1 transcriptional regulator, ArsR family [Zymomonas mobilis subsp. pomaceae ATCC 29192]MDX5947951.1 metalloregulator ArsR/SmtB family transcription factor [Zymomonas mobilis subsp. pomaceae]GEB89280.1 ArsR family transcriptional regulator [Zymomonas mobilis subsp. pomaceae]